MIRWPISECKTTKMRVCWDIDRTTVSWDHKNWTCCFEGSQKITIEMTQLPFSQHALSFLHMYLLDREVVMLQSINFHAKNNFSVSVFAILWKRFIFKGHALILSSVHRKVAHWHWRGLMKTVASETASWLSQVTGSTATCLTRYSFQEPPLIY